MRWNTLLKFKTNAGWVTSAALIAAAVAGCAHVNNPWRDSSASIDEDMTTQSTQGYMANAHAARPIARTWESSSVVAENGAVTHWPLWFEDPFEDKGNAYCSPADRDAPDNVFAWNGVDYLHMGYGPARYFLNTAGWPISAVVTPPGTLMESDGRIDKGIWGYDFDERRADSVTREPPDVNIIEKHPMPSPPPPAAQTPPEAPPAR